MELLQTILNTDDFMQLDEEFICSICMGVLKYPALTPCGHHFCKKCIEELQKRSSLCPLDREPISVFFLDKSIERKILAKHCKCPHRESGCDWSGQLTEFTKHNCSFKMVYCDLGCGASFQLRYREVHLRGECPERKCVCDHCSVEVLFKMIQKHFMECTTYPIQCPNMGCEKMLPRNEMSQHRVECPAELITCSLITCEDKFPRSQLDLHMSQKMNQHLLSLQKIVLELRDAHHRKDAQIQALLTEVNKRNFPGKLTWDPAMSDMEGFSLHDGDKTIMRYEASISPRAYSLVSFRYGTIAFTYRSSGDRQSEIALVEKRLDKRGLVEGEGVYWVISKTKQYLMYVDTFQGIASLEGEVRYISSEPQYLLFGTGSYHVAITIDYVR